MCVCRGLPPGEREQLVKMTSEMFECNFDNIPAEFFLSSFHFTYATSREASYIQCIRNLGILSESHGVCRAGLGICKPTTFLRQDISEFCYKAKQTSADSHAEYLNSPQFSDPRRVVFHISSFISTFKPLHCFGYLIISPI